MPEKVLNNIATVTNPTASNNYVTAINIITSNIGKEIDKNSRIINATLILSVNAVKGTGFEVKAQSNNGIFEIIDFVSPSKAGDKVYINITEELGDIIKNSNEKVVIKIEGTSSQNISFTNDISLKIEHIPERIMYENNAYYDISAGKAGSGKINLATGVLQFVHSDSAASGISHVYNSWQAGKTGTELLDENGKPVSIEYGCGEGWKLSLHQYLVKHKGTSNQDIYTYIDGSGNYHEFTERYYYKVDKEKVYVDKKDVGIGLDGKLSYNGHEIKTELKTTSGLMLSAELSDFQGLEKLELRSKDRAQLESNIEQLENEKERLENEKERLENEKENISREKEQIDNQIRELIQKQYAEATEENFKALIEAEMDYQKASDELYALQYSQNAFINSSRYYDDASKKDMREGGYSNKNNLNKKLKKTYEKIGIRYVNGQDLWGNNTYNTYNLTAWYYDSDNGRQMQTKSIVANLEQPTRYQSVPAQYTFENEYESYNIEIARLTLLMENASIENQKETVAKINEVIKAKNDLKQERDKYAKKLEMLNAVDLDTKSQLESFKYIKSMLER
jgi:hypothetical protein